MASLTILPSTRTYFLIKESENTHHDWYCIVHYLSIIPPWDDAIMWWQFVDLLWLRHKWFITEKRVAGCWRVKDVDCCNYLPTVPQDHPPPPPALSWETDLQRLQERAPLPSGFSFDADNSELSEETRWRENHHWVALGIILPWFFSLLLP